MNPMDQVRSRRLTAMLEEALGGGAPEALAERIARRLRAEPSPRRHRVRAALLMAAGIAVVVAAGWLHDPDGRQAAQDPEPAPQIVIITSAMLQTPSEPVVEPPPGPAVDRLLAIAGRTKVCMVTTDAVTGESKCSLAACDWRQAVDKIAAEIGVGVSMFGNVLVVGIGPAAEQTRLPRVTFDQTPLHEVLATLGRSPGFGLVFPADEQGRVEGAAAVRVTMDVADVAPRALVDVIAAKAGLEVVPAGRMLALRRAGPGQKPQRMALQFRQRAIAEVFGTWAKLNGRNVVIDRAVQGNVSVRAMQIEEADLLTALTAAVGAEVETLDRGILRIVPRRPLPTQKRTVLASQGIPLADVAQLIGLTGEQCQVAPDCGRVSVFANAAQLEPLDMLRAAAIAAGRTLCRREEHHRIE